MRHDRSWLRPIARAAAALLLLAGQAALADGGEPFGLASVAVSAGPLAMTWAKLTTEMKAERAVIARCRVAPRECGSTPALQFIALVDQGNGFSGLARIGHINRAVNFAIRAADEREPAHRDAWTSPLAALAAGAGDCKQYAVLKYAALREAGFALADLRIVIVKQRLRPEMHAMVAVRHAGRWLMLDNRTLAMVDSGKLRAIYTPLDTLDARGVRQFIHAPRLAGKFGAACAG